MDRNNNSSTIEPFNDADMEIFRRIDLNFFSGKSGVVEIGWSNSLHQRTAISFARASKPRKTIIVCSKSLASKCTRKQFIESIFVS